MDCIRIGALLASLRREKGMTQRAVASLLGVSDKAVSKWERNLSRPDVDSLPLLAETLHTTVETLNLNTLRETARLLACFVRDTLADWGTIQWQ